MNTPDIHKIDALLQLILTTASQEDWDSRELGPIHLIKYLYLADLAHAEQSNGDIYTGLPWRFHHFGPWEALAYQRISPALGAIGAKKKTLASFRYDKEFVRWSVQDDDLHHRLQNKMPLSIAGAVQIYIRKFGSFTEDLLDFVYKTWPMVHAKPGELLNFNPPEYIHKKATHQAFESEGPVLTARQQKKKKQVIETLKKQFRAKQAHRKKRKKITPTAPLYDDIFLQGLKTLDHLAGKEIELKDGVVYFSDDLWKSKARFDPDVS